MCVCTRVSICVHVETRGQPLLLFLRSHLPLFCFVLKKSLSLPCRSLSTVGWLASKPQGPACLCLIGTGVVAAQHPGDLPTSISLVLGLQVHRTGDLPISVSLVLGLQCTVPRRPAYLYLVGTGVAGAEHYAQLFFFSFLSLVLGIKLMSS